MLSKLLGEKLLYRIYLFAYCVLIFGLVYKNLVMSLATIFLLLLTVLDFNRKEYLLKIKGNPLLKYLILLFLIHLLSLLWTNNFSYFFKDFNTKLNLYFIPIIFVLKPIQSKKDVNLLLVTFLVSITLFTGINFYDFLVSNAINEYNMHLESKYISHIRFALMLIFGIVVCLYLLKSQKSWIKWILMALICWFLIYTFYAEVLVSYLILAVLLLFLTFQLISKLKRFKKTLFILYFGSILAVIFSGIYLFRQFESENIAPKQSELKARSAEGNPYFHAIETHVFMNGHHVFSNICNIEIFREWAKVSKFHLFEKNKFDSQHYYVLLQYMASKGLKKDAEGFKHLTKQDILKIEAGECNYLGKPKGMLNRFRTLYEEFYNSDPNGKSSLQRVEFWKTGSKILAKNMLIGVSPGNLADEFVWQYERDKSKLLPENRLRAHNQILTYFISFGVLGGTIFLIVFYKSFQYFRKNKIKIAFYFLLIMFLSFFTEDTLETQVGVTLFSVFFGLFISTNVNFLTSKVNEN